MRGLEKEHRGPSVVVLENVCGALTSHGGKDFTAIGTALVDGGYRFGALVMDAVHFVPQSRPRLFIVAVREGRNVPVSLIRQQPGLPTLWSTRGLTAAFERLPLRAKRAWLWWNVPAPEPRRKVFADLIEDEPQGVTWHTAAETRALLRMMSPINRAKVDEAMRAGRRIVGGVYKRTRQGVQRAEVRFDDVAGCLRTPSGGSSRQTIMIVESSKIRSRLLSPREAARLMGLPETYQLPANYNEAYHLAGDGLVVPVVRHLTEHILEPLLLTEDRHDKKAA
jgi:DNA (cytosine-5)-methyltransferase 1